MNRSPRRVPFVPALAVCTAALLGPASAAAQTETVEYYASDAIGSVRVVFDTGGTVIGRMDYAPFGQELYNGLLMPDNRFAQLQRDGEAALDYAEARMFQPRVGRFTDTDRVFVTLRNPQGWNRYVYALNNPFTYVDPSGRCPVWRPDNQTWDFTGCSDSSDEPDEPAEADDHSASIEFFIRSDLCILGIGPGCEKSGGGGGSGAGGNQKPVITFVPCPPPKTGMCLPGDLPPPAMGGVPPGAAAGGAAVVAAGKFGEQLARNGHNIGPKLKFWVNGRWRIADGYLRNTLQEIKNVRYQAYTQQLRDYVQYAQQQGLTVELLLRANTATSDPLARAVSAGLIKVICYGTGCK